jgi:phage repressor protein C with HTH and peptisase S24 domain
MLRDSGNFDDPGFSGPRGTHVRTLPVYDLTTSAGRGKLLDLPDYKPMQVGREVPMSANFGVVIAGDSMEPDFHDGQIVWIHQQSRLTHGDIGVFLYEGQPYFKRLRDRVGGTRLQSVDSHFPDIIVSDPGALVTLGKVAE